MDKTTMVPTLPESGVKVTPVPQLPPTQPAFATEDGISDEASSVNKAA
jgi:hypothetical protein